MWCSKYFVDGIFVFVRHCGEINIFSFISARMLEESDLLVIIMTGKDTWVFQHDPETNRQSLKSLQNRESANVKIKGQIYVGPTFLNERNIRSEFVPSKQINKQ
jgi:hypothetical protein